MLSSAELRPNRFSEYAATISHIPALDLETFDKQLTPLKRKLGQLDSSYEHLLSDARAKIDEIAEQSLLKLRVIKECEQQMDASIASIEEKRVTLASRISRFHAVEGSSGFVKWGSWVAGGGLGVATAAGFTAVTGGIGAVLIPVSLGVFGSASGATNETLAEENKALIEYAPADLDKIVNEDPLDFKDPIINEKGGILARIKTIFEQLKNQPKTKNEANHLSSLIHLLERNLIISDKYKKIYLAALKVLDKLKEEEAKLDRLLSQTNGWVITKKIFTNMKDLVVQMKDTISGKKRPRDDDDSSKTNKSDKVEENDSKTKKEKTEEGDDKN